MPQQSKFTIKTIGKVFDRDFSENYFSREIEKAVLTSLVELHQTATGFTPVNIGKLRGNTFLEARGTPIRGGVVGVQGMAEKYVLPVEYGQRPHWAPIAPLIYWVQRKFGGKGGLFRISSAVSKKGNLLFKRKRKAEGGLRKARKKEEIDARTKAAAYGVQHKIAKKGVDSTLMFDRAYQLNVRQIEARFDELAERIANAGNNG